MSEIISSVHPEASTSGSPATNTSVEASPIAPRTTGRTRVKSQRVLEAEDTKRYLLKQAQAQVNPQHQETPGRSAKPTTYSKKGKGKKKVDNEVYCVCKTDNEGSMIECGECNDWFHFSCIDLKDDEAEKIHEYICDECTQSTSKRTTYKYDISTFVSPSPPPGIIPAKRKQPKSEKATPSHSSEDNDSGSEAEIDQATSSSRQSSVHATPPPNKKPRPSTDNKRKSSLTVNRQTSVERKPSSAGGALPPMRKYVREKLAPLFKGLFEGMNDEDAEKFGNKVEEGIFTHFKESINGKETAGNRYKTQFNLLSSSIAKGLRQDIISSITSHTLSPIQIATLTSADLASEEQLAAIQRAKQAVLEQTVKSKSDDLVSSSIRLGRDGFERVENAREKEMKLLSEQEELNRLKVEQDRLEQELRLKKPEPEKSPITKDIPKFKAEPQRSNSIDVSSPLRQTFVHSAWSGTTPTKEANEENDSMTISNFDQTNLDLSDIINLDGDMEIDDGLDDKPVEETQPSEMEVFESKEILWSGGITNPAAPSKHIPPMSLRLISRAPTLDWKLLLPHQTIEITGRVPTKTSLQFISEMRLNPSRELVTVAFSLDSKATDEEILTWEEMVEYHIGKDRHAVYLPYGKHPPAGAAKELYLIPLRPEDPSPEFTELIDGYFLPKEGRSTSVFLGVFICSKMSGSAPIPTAPRSDRPPTPPLPPPPVAPTIQPAASSVLPIPNEQLQALMASLNPTSLQGLVGGITPPVGGTTPPIAIGSTTPMPPPQPQQGYDIYPQQPYPAYPQQNYDAYHQQGYLDSRLGSRSWEGSEGRDPRGERRRDQWREERRDNGWGSRGGHRQY
ncbi:uncharacterized protein L201_005368 [Kwoniella dendrophila CBS 6074]|uniref:Transcription factor BYE1 n=1 Tax=Kwoniella dendrophila CBS 6074 TaxID=1295534 RepID=A0AAX4K119_9TREE